MTEAGETDAIIALSHDGTNDDTYYGFYTSDLTASVEDAVNNKVDELKSTVSDLASVLFKGKTRNAVLGGSRLRPTTDISYSDLKKTVLCMEQRAAVISLQQSLQP